MKKEKECNCKDKYEKKKNGGRKREEIKVRKKEK